MSEDKANSIYLSKSFSIKNFALVKHTVDFWLFPRDKSDYMDV